jgi:hypothetical protein
LKQEKNMTELRMYLVVFIAILIPYTLVVMNEHGCDFVAAYFSVIADMSWSGQFAVDFTMFLVLNGLWLAWRHQFSAAGIVLGVLVPVGGMLYFAPYLLYSIYQANNDIQVVILGKTRAAELRRCAN